MVTASKDNKKKKAMAPKKKQVVKRTTRKMVKVSSKKKSVSQKKPSAKESGQYIETIGRRKTSRARVRIWTKGDKVILVNDKSYKEYFPSFELQQIVLSPLSLMKMMDKFRIIIKASGGGIHSQAEAVRHGIARALVELNSDFRKRLKRAGFLTRDPRMRERKKFGLKRARRAPQWQKR